MKDRNAPRKQPPSTFMVLYSTHTYYCVVSSEWGRVPFIQSGSGDGIGAEREVLLQQSRWHWQTLLYPSLCGGNFSKKTRPAGWCSCVICVKFLRAVSLSYLFLSNALVGFRSLTSLYRLQFFAASADRQGKRDSRVLIKYLNFATPDVPR